MANKSAADGPADGKDRMAFYLTFEQREKVRALAFEQRVTQSKIVGDLIDAAKDPGIKRD